MTTTIRPGTTGTYWSTRGYQKAAIVIGTHDSIEPDTDAVRPEEGYVHLMIIGLVGVDVCPNVPVREVAETIPDYRIDGKLVGFFEAV